MARHGFFASQDEVPKGKLNKASLVRVLRIFGYVRPYWLPFSLGIAYRLSTGRNANKILVLDKGKIKEAGTHAEVILKQGGLYKNLSQLQFELN